MVMETFSFFFFFFFFRGGGGGGEVIEVYYGIVQVVNANLIINALPS